MSVTKSFMVASMKSLWASMYSTSSPSPHCLSSSFLFSSYSFDSSFIASRYPADRASMSMMPLIQFSCLCRASSSISAISDSSFMGSSSLDMAFLTDSFRASSLPSSSIAERRSIMRSRRSLEMDSPMTSERRTYPRGWSAYLTSWGGGPPTLEMSSLSFSGSSVSYLMASPSRSLRSNHGSSLSLAEASAAASADARRSPLLRRTGTSFWRSRRMTFRFSSLSESVIVWPLAAMSSSLALDASSFIRNASFPPSSFHPYFPGRGLM
mmetsp:Transcript_5381/g.11692  ORF Transcript_5381/g.11692 Transcript_5381/m.11692 type:complete len:267 (+) Transcript_5381:410-1210(+)